MKNIEIQDLSVLLIQVPGHHPACWSEREGAVACCLASVSQHLDFSDAGRDFIQKVLLNPQFLILAAHRAAARGQRPIVVADAAQDPDAGIDGYGLAPPGSGISSLPARLISADWAQIETMIEDLMALESALELVSAAYHPCRFHRYGFAHPGLNTLENLIAFREDPEANPFWAYAFEQWQPVENTAAPDVAVLCITAIGQLLAATTLAHAWRQRWPGIPLLAAGPGLLTAEIKAKLFFEGQYPSANDAVQRLADRLSTLDAEFASELMPPRICSDAKGWPGMRRAPFRRPLIADRIPSFAQAASAEGRKLIVWSDTTDDVGDIGRQLHAVARQGFWNHLLLGDNDRPDMEKFALNNANIVHSWCRQASSLSPFSDSGSRYPDAAPAYGKTAPMPGRPLWMVLRDPVYLEAALERFELNTLQRMRIRDDGRGFFEVGRCLRYHFVPPADLPEGYLEEIVRMVAAGGSVNTQFVKYNLERAYLVAYAEEEGVIIGNSSLKHPRDEYIEAVSRQSGIDLHNFLERGYTSVRPEYRGLGIGAQLLAGLTERAGDHKIFSVIAEGNIATQKMAIRNRTRRVATFFSQRAQKAVSVWIPEWMLPEGINLPEQPEID